MSEIITQEEALVISPQPWYPLPNEPHTWYARFSNFFLTQPSTNRSVLEAYRQHRIAKATNEQERIAAQNVTSVAEGWYKASHDWQWSARVQAYDRYITDRLLEQNSQALLTHKAHKLNHWTQYLERASAELARREVGEVSLNLLTSTIKTISHVYHAELPQQPQLSLHIHAIHPDLQKLIRDAIESRE